MRMRALILIFALLALMASGCMEKMPPKQYATQPPAGARLAQLPKISVGDYWLYEFIDNTGTGGDYVYSIKVTETMPDGSFKAKFYDRKKEIGHTRNYDSNYIFTSVDGKDGVNFDVINRGEHNFPFWVGKRWTTHFQSRDLSGSTRSYTRDYVVVSYEKVKVPAGVFEAFKVRYNQAAVGQTRTNFINYYWYAPKAKTIVKWDTEQQGIELLEYKVSPN